MCGSECVLVAATRPVARGAITALPPRFDTWGSCIALYCVAQVLLQLVGQLVHGNQTQMLASMPVWRQSRQVAGDSEVVPALPLQQQNMCPHMLLHAWAMDYVSSCCVHACATVAASAGPAWTCTALPGSHLTQPPAHLDGSGVLGLAGMCGGLVYVLFLRCCAPACLNTTPVTVSSLDTAAFLVSSLDRWAWTGGARSTLLFLYMSLCVCVRLNEAAVRLDRACSRLIP